MHIHTRTIDGGQIITGIGRLDKGYLKFLGQGVERQSKNKNEKLRDDGGSFSGFFFPPWFASSILLFNATNRAL